MSMDSVNMLALCSLQSLYQKQSGSHSTLFERTVSQFLHNSSSPFPDDLLAECSWQEPLFSEEASHQNWKELLAFNLLCDLTSSHQTDIAAKVRLFERNPWNQSSQYFRSIVAVNHAFAKMPIPEVGPHLLESGAALIDLHEYCPWLSLPYHPHHVEFGLYVCLLALITKRQDLREIVLQLAHWQLNTLDASARPLNGIFVREKEGKSFQYLALSYLLFRSSALLLEETSFAAVAEASMQGIQEMAEKGDHRIHPLWVLIERWLEKFKIQLSKPLSLPEQIYDPSTALIGYRTSTQHVICSLHGEHTGLGVLRYGHIDIVSYGPQYLPLGECRGFGIEGNAVTDHGMRRSAIEWRPHSFSLKGCTRLVDQPASSPLEACKYRGIWLDVTQEFKKPDFYLKTTFLGLDGWDSVAFSFFIKASRCVTHAQECLLPRTLGRYEGSAQTLTFEAKESVLELRPLSFKGIMQVIPLSGGNDFWGADFLIAYLMSPDQRHYQWHIGPPRSDRGS
jgi:hypothetical protein